ncbi:MAG TPA: hypothetical protein VNG51_19270 [Ktedonobacteraceae bacterium]|nr:hypothetical protein [Ktedonobacteraceae bacterium]
MRPLSILFLAVTFFLAGLIKLGAATITDHAFGWLLLADAIVLLLDPVVPAVVGYFHSRRAPQA